MKGRILLSVALVMVGWTVPSLAAVRAGVTTYRVQLVLYPGDDGAAVAKRLAAMYRGTLETAVDGDGSFTIALSPATADLMGRDPAVQHLELGETTPAPMVTTAAALETTAVATPWKLGDYQYDGSGNIRRIGADFYAYDNRNRLVLSADASQSPLVPKQSYTYDSFGNMTSVSTAGSQLTTMSVNTSSNRVTAVTAAGASTTTGYDQAGNMTRYGTATYSYDALNMLTRSTFDGLTRGYIYSASDERIGTIEVSAAGTRSEWTIRDAAGQVLRRFSKESTGEWKWQEDYIYRGSQMLAAEVPDSTKTRHFHLDHLGTPRLITGNGGVELSRQNYHPFGMEIASTSSTATAREKKQFTGHERDAESLDYMHARFYAPYMGRFLSVDPTLTSAKQSLPQSWNRYSYAMDTPLTLIDPDGKVVYVAPAMQAAVNNGRQNSPAFAAMYDAANNDPRVYWTIRSAANAKPGTRADSTQLTPTKDEKGIVTRIMTFTNIPSILTLNVQTQLIAHEGAHVVEVLESNKTLKERFEGGERGEVRPNTAAGPNSYESQNALLFERMVREQLTSGIKVYLPTRNVNDLLRVAPGVRP
jgi:RHS repeat-associated protein